MNCRQLASQPGEYAFYLWGNVAINTWMGPITLCGAETLERVIDEGCDTHISMGSRTGYPAPTAMQLASESAAQSYVGKSALLSKTPWAASGAPRIARTESAADPGQLASALWRASSVEPR